MTEYGGYIEFENYYGSEYHSEAIALNCGRACLEYLIKANGITCIHLPFYLCGSVYELCHKCGIEVISYEINKDFLPKKTIGVKQGEWLYIVNYYGQLTDEYLRALKLKYDKLIVDNAQAFFSMPVDNIDTIYTCRKFFGVADGAYLYTQKKLHDSFEEDITYDRMTYLLGRYEKGANEFYNLYTNNNKMFASQPIKKMSRLTQNIMRSLDYNIIEKKRNNNFEKYFQILGNLNELKLKMPNAPFMYPFLCRNADKIRKYLQKKKVYIPMLWPKINPNDAIGSDYAVNILPLPCDQRYSEEDIKYISYELMKAINEYGV